MNSAAPCFGVMCERHQDCARYYATDGPFHDIVRIGFCDEKRTGFIPIVPIKGET